MDSVLKKTIASLETALRYNPENVDLMTALTENYVRMGRLDSVTMELVEKVLARHPDNVYLLQAQAVTYVIEQTDQLDASLIKGHPLPPDDVIHSSISILDEFLAEISGSCEAWFAWTRLNLLAGRYEDFARGIDKLVELEWPGLKDLQRLLDWVSRKQPVDKVSWMSLYDAYCKIEDQRSGIKLLERVYDRGAAKDEIGSILFQEYSSKYSPERADEVPESVRPRFLQVLLSHGESRLTDEWLRKASLYSWQLSENSKDYARSLIADDQIESAFGILQRMVMDDEVRQMLNEIASHYEQMDMIEEAVRILQYINGYDVNDEGSVDRLELELTRNTELSLADLHMKNGRLSDALAKYIAAMCLSKEPEKGIFAKIEELLAKGVTCDAEEFVRLATFFKNRNDLMRAIRFYSQAIEINPGQREAAQELEVLIDQLLEAEPDHPLLRLERGRLRHLAGQNDMAVIDYKIAAVSPEYELVANRRLAVIYKQEGKYRDALICWQHGQPSENDLEEVYQLGIELARHEDFRGAVQALHMVQSVNDDFRDVRERLAQLKDRATRIVQPAPGAPPQSGSDSEIKMRDLIGELAVGRFRYMDKVGSGGMGVVYKAVDIRQQRTVAIKILRDGLAGSSKAIERFFREARIAQTIQHPNIVNIFDFNISSQDGQNYIVMEYIEGQSLREFIDLHFDETISTSVDYINEMLYYMVQLFDALYATHGKGITHRDIKPDNIMITTQGQVKITDFGIVHVDDATFTPTGAMLGTPRYMSPEQVTGGRIDGRSDIYSVGIMLYEVLIGSPPFMTGDISYQQVNKEPVEPRLLNSAVPASVSNFIMRCLEKKPEARFQDAMAARDAIAQILASLGGCQKYLNLSPLAGREAQQRIAAPPKAPERRAQQPSSPPPGTEQRYVGTPPAPGRDNTRHEVKTDPELRRPAIMANASKIDDLDLDMPPET